jgi:glutathione S-transferase
MITVWGEGRGLRVVWLLEEMQLPYRLRGVDLLKGVENDPEFMAINPCGFIPALQDGEMVMVESIAIMEYLLARYGHASKAAHPLAPAPTDPAYGPYQQFLHLGEAGLMMPIYMKAITGFIAPESERDNWTAREGAAIFQNRFQLVTRRLASAPYMAGEHFTAADISVSYALAFARRHGSMDLGEPATAYIRRCANRDAYRRALDICVDSKPLYANP